MGGKGGTGYTMTDLIAMGQRDAQSQYYSRNAHAGMLGGYPYGALDQLNATGVMAGGCPTGVMSSRQMIIDETAAEMRMRLNEQRKAGVLARAVADEMRQQKLAHELRKIDLPEYLDEAISRGQQQMAAYFDAVEGK